MILEPEKTIVAVEEAPEAVYIVRPSYTSGMGVLCLSRRQPASAGHDRGYRTDLSAEPGGAQPARTAARSLRDGERVHLPARWQASGTPTREKNGTACLHPRTPADGFLLSRWRLRLFRRTGNRSRRWRSSRCRVASRMDGPFPGRRVHPLRRTGPGEGHARPEGRRARTSSLSSTRNSPRIRPAAAIRAASTSVGKRLLSLYSSICGDEQFPEVARLLPHGNAPVAYALVFFHRGIAEHEAALAFGYNRLAGMVSAGLRLISIGHQQGQQLLSQTIERLPAAVDRIMEMVDEPVRSFNPRLDIQQMNHQYVYSRLFRS